jgi:hypothetical protein
MRSLFVGLVVSAVVAQSSAAGTVVLLSDPSGLSAELEFTLVNPTTLEVRAKNTSTGVPLGFSNSDQLLTGVSWDFGVLGEDPADPKITGGSVKTGPSSSSVNFDVLNVGPNADISGEFGYSNTDGSGGLTNVLTSNKAQATPFGGANLDGPANIDGPQGGLIASTPLVALGGLGAINDEYIATLTLDKPLADLSFLALNPVRVEFGSDAAFIPEPASLGLLTLGGMILLGRRR